MKKILRITTVPISLLVLLRGQLSFINQYYKVIAIANPEPILDEVKIQEGVQVKGIAMNRSISPFKDLRSIIEMYRYIKKERPFIVHSHTPKAGMVAMFASKLANTKVRIHTVAGMPLLEAKGLKRKILEFVDFLTYKCATEILVNSKGLKDIIIKDGLAPESKIKVIGHGSSNGIDTKYFKQEQIPERKKANLREKFGLEDNDVVFIFVGRIVKDKGVQELVTAFNRLNYGYPNAKLLLLGRREDQLDPISKKTNVLIESNKSIIEVGFKKDVRPYMAISDVLVHPSYREGFPNVVLQAGAMELASIVSNINGCNEIISDGINGCIIKVKNEDDLYRAMHNVLTDKKLRSLLSQNARTLIKDRFEQSFIWNELLKYYQSFES